VTDPAAHKVWLQYYPNYELESKKATTNVVDLFTGIEFEA
jgi:hypothetical protein